MKVIQCFHRNRDIRDPLVDQLLCSFSGLVLEHNTRGRIHGRSLEISLPVPADEFAKPLPAIQNPDLRPKIHETIGRRGAGQSDPSFHIRADFPQEFKTLGLVVLER